MATLGNTSITQLTVLNNVSAAKFVGPLQGNADTATKLGTRSVGSLTKGIFLNNGTATEMTYSLNKSVPSDAVFTDTKVTAVGNHYTPSGGSALTPTSSGTATRGSTVVMTGVTKDAAGHITGVTGYTLPASDKVTYSAGTGLSLSGTTFNHSNSVSAITTPGFYKIKYDAQGHITETTAVAKADITALGIPGSDTNTAHGHSYGVGLVGSGNAGTSGTYTYKAALADETLDTNASVTRPGADANRIYPVIPDKNGKLAVIVPWVDTNDHYTYALTIQGGGTTAQTFSQNAAKTINFKGSGATSVSKTADGEITISSTDTDTKNTAGSTDTSSKIYLVGATSQAASPQTYSDNEVFATSGVLTTKSVQIGGGSCTLQYADDAVKFVFA